MRVSSKSYNEAFRSDAARLVRRGDRTLKQVAHDLGVNHWTLRDWVRRYEMPKKRSTAASKSSTTDKAAETLEQSVARLEKENARLERQVAQLEMDREILKKAAAFFAKESE